MIKRKNIIKIAIDSPAAAGAGTLAKAISKHYNLFYLDTGKIYRMIAYLKIKFPKKFNQNFIKSKIKSLKVKDLADKALLSDEVGTEASRISKNKKTSFFVGSPGLKKKKRRPGSWAGAGGLAARLAPAARKPDWHWRLETNKNSSPGNSLCWVEPVLMGPG